MNELVLQESDLVLTRLDTARTALVEAKTVQETKKIIDIATAAQILAKRQKLGQEAINYANEIKLEALAQLGGMLKEMEKNKGALLRGTNLEPRDITPTLADLGLDKKISKLAQDISSLSSGEPGDFDKLKKGKTTISKVRAKLRKKKQIKKEKNSKVKKKDVVWNITGIQDVISCNLLLTDPPYGILSEEWEPDDLEKFTKEWLSRWNNCGADYFVSFWSQRYLFNGKEWFDECLTNYEFVQLLIWNYPNNKGHQSRSMFKQTYEPIYLYRKKDSEKQILISGSDWGNGLNDFDVHTSAVPQSNFNNENTKQHPAQKPMSVMSWLINCLSTPGEMVCDPFCGSGTTGISSVQVGRNFHGIEISKEYRDLSERRIRTYG